MGGGSGPCGHPKGDTPYPHPHLGVLGPRATGCRARNELVGQALSRLPPHLEKSFPAPVQRPLLGDRLQEGGGLLPGRGSLSKRDGVSKEGRASPEEASGWVDAAPPADTSPGRACSRRAGGQAAGRRAGGGQWAGGRRGGQAEPACAASSGRAEALLQGAPAPGRSRKWHVSQSRGAGSGAGSPGCAGEQAGRGRGRPGTGW